MAITSQNAINGIDGSFRDSITITEDSYISISTTGTPSPANPFSSKDGSNNPLWDNDSFDSIQSVLTWMEISNLTIESSSNVFLRIRIFPGIYQSDTIYLDNPQLAYTYWYVDQSDFTELPSWSNAEDTLTDKLNQLETNFPVKIVFNNVNGFVIRLGQENFINIGEWSRIHLKCIRGISSSAIGLSTEGLDFLRDRISYKAKFTNSAFSGFVTAISVIDASIDFSYSFINTSFGLQATDSVLSGQGIHAIYSDSNSGGRLVDLINSKLDLTITSWNYFSGNVSSCESSYFSVVLINEIQVGVISISESKFTNTGINLDNYRLILLNCNITTFSLYIKLDNDLPYPDLTSEPCLLMENMCKIYFSYINIFTVKSQAIRLILMSEIVADNICLFTALDGTTPKLVTAETGSKASFPSSAIGTFSPAPGVVGSSGEVIYVAS